MAIGPRNSAKPAEKEVFPEIAPHSSLSFGGRASAARKHSTELQSSIPSFSAENSERKRTNKKRPRNTGTES